MIYNYEKVTIDPPNVGSTSKPVYFSGGQPIVCGALSYTSATGVTNDPYYRPIRISTVEPTSSDGNIGDIWIVYSAD